MSVAIFQRTNSLHRAAWFALFAVALILIAPLISVSLQKDPMAAMPGMHHDMPMMGESPHALEKPVLMPVDHAEACGYCVLLAHVPGLLLALVLLVCALLLPGRTTPVRLTVQHRYFFPWLYPETRAPPRRSAFTCE
ncbi:DUF2946 domain-containing protein [Pluralibacter sp.]|uniref:DUF2946 domain-containing protein n=1 Tax=Pluralibacter sp. TaxID=1920032 RepID=UPI0025EEB478|nr:DUF2946 domain-containing protein [Pluralibacter sp.]